jgi:hypothetical protein
VTMRVATRHSWHRSRAAPPADRGRARRSQSDAAIRPRAQPQVRATSRPDANRIRVGTISIPSRCDTSSALSSTRPGTISGNDGSSWVYTVSPGSRTKLPSTGTASTQVGQSRLTTATKPSRGRPSGITHLMFSTSARMNRVAGATSAFAHRPPPAAPLREVNFGPTPGAQTRAAPEGAALAGIKR